MSADETTHGSTAEILDLDAELLAEHTASITARLPVTDPRSIVDVGCGTGAGTFALLARFPGAHVTAVDSSPAHLQRLREKADSLGLSHRVRTIEADLGETWPDLGPMDLAWASGAMHHMPDPDRTLRHVYRALSPGGVFALVELAGFPRFLPAEAPEFRPGVEDRFHSLNDQRHAADLRHRGADWGPKLTAAGFTLAAHRTITIKIEAARAEAVGRYALMGLRRLRDAVSDVASAQDLEAFDQLLDVNGPHNIFRRTDLAMRTERAVWIGRRP